MATAIFMVLMVCGYWYASRDLSTRLKFKRTFGWDVYFLVALYGCIFVLQGLIATGLLWGLLLLISTILNQTPLGEGYYHHYQIDFMTGSFLGVQGPVMAMLSFTIFICLYRSNWAKSARLGSAERRELYKYLTRANGVEGILYECMEEGELAWVTLKSQRIYIGMIQTASFDSGNSSNIVLIPMLSGYRDENTLDLHVEHNYSAWYHDHNISLTSEEITALAFRKVIMLDQIESLSLFDPASELAMPLSRGEKP